jgi:hypothetical protein
MGMEDLPTELWTLICNARTPYTSVNGEHPIIDDATLSNVRLASRTLHHKTQDAFLQRHLSCSKFSLAPMSLELLRELSENKNLRPYTKELEFGPDVLNTRLDQDPKFCKGKSYNRYPAELSVRDLPWSVWPIAKLRGSFNLSAARKAHMIVRWEDSYASWAAKYEDRFRDLRDEQWEYREDQVDIDMLLAAIPKFPNLRNIKIDTRPAGPIFSQLFDAQIRPSKGTMALGRAIGAAEMNLSADDNPKMLE